MRQPLVILSGPTAAGKTALAVALADQLEVEVISADSRQVYRGFDIGTAKPSLDELRAVRHHLIDVADPDQRFDVAQFVSLARVAIEETRARGRLPVVAGGTGLYLRALCGGLSPSPGRDEALRARLEQERRASGDDALHARLARVDPEAAARIPPADAVRVVRALEVFELTGRPISAHQRAHAFADRPYRVLWLVIDRPQPALVARIERRARAMFVGGLVEEARALRERWGPIALLDTMGYREALALADGALDQDEAVARTAVRTRRYAKRQRTWLRKEPVDHWLEAPAPEALLRVVRESSILDGVEAL